MKTLAITTLTIVGLTFASCNKYEEGPALSIIPKNERVANTWQIYYAQDDGQNVSDNYDQYTLYLTADGAAQLDADYFVLGTQYQTSTQGTWSFENDKQDIRLDYEDDSEDQVYQILMLKSDEMRLRAKGDDLELRFTGS